MRKTIFHEEWWLDAVAPGRWREASASRGGRVVGYMRYVERMMGKMTICEMPQITRVLGPVISPEGDKTESRLRFGHSVLQELLEAIATHDHVEMTLEPSFDNLSAFLSAGFDVRIMPTLLLDCRRPIDDLWAGLRDKTRNLARRAGERLKVQEVTDPEAFMAFYLANLRGEPSYFDLCLPPRIFEAAAARGQAKILSATDQNDTVHAAVFFIWDDQKAYYYLSTRDGDIADIGAVTLLMWEGIQLAQRLGLEFDFDGVTSDARYKFMSAFGGEPATRFIVSRSTASFDTQRNLRGFAKSILKPEWLRRPKMAAAIQ